MKTYKFKLYKSKKNRNIHRQINASGSIYNHCIALHKRYYKIFGKHLNMYRLMKHIAKLRKRIKYWQQVGSQAVQDICQRIDKAYKLFFKQCKSGTRPPNFKKTRKYKSFTLKQAGYKFLEGNKVRISNRIYKFSKTRDIKGKVKTLTVKRNNLGELFILVVTDFEERPRVGVRRKRGVQAFEVSSKDSPLGMRSDVDESFGVVTGKIAGFDFGLKTFLTASDLTTVESPLFFNQFRSELKAANKKISSKRKGSNNWYKAKDNLNRVYKRISQKRKDWFWKLAHELTNKYDVLIFEDLNLKGMKKLWGRKVSDLSF